MTSDVKPLAAGWGVLLGALAAVFGLIPWLITGMRLPLQNLWATSTLDMPIALLPFSQYELTPIAAFLVVGAAVAGLLVRVGRGRMPRARAVIAGVAAVQLIALAQTSIVVLTGLQRGREATLYFVAVFAWSALSFLVGMLALWLILHRARAAALLGLTVGAVAVEPWLRALIMPFGTITPSPLQLWAAGAAGWVGAVLVGAAIAWCGLATRGRIVAAIGLLLILALLPNAVHAVASAAGTRVYARDPARMLEFARSVFTTELGIPFLTVQPLLLAVAVAAVGLVARRSIQGISPADPMA
ncbi:hypothetical protein [Microbacterium sp. KR10-403]|uniref:hypothetical protein n=1 Tax=Microbacterium sp. KR10-403 TaxID=3158581 RepID=UPI0032E378DE